MQVYKAQVNGNIKTNQKSLRGNAIPVGQTIIQNAVWGTITGEIERQEDLQIELHERDNDGLSVQEIEAILYL